MTTCRACSAEIVGRDRFCRNCGAPVAVSVEDLTDTYRFNPTASPPANVHTDPTNPFYAPPPAAYPAAQGAVQTASLGKRLFQRKFVWVMIILLLAVFFGSGIGIGRMFLPRWGEPVQWQAQGTEEQAEAARRAYEEAVQNALGFKQGSFSDAEFAGVQGIFVNSLMSDDCPAALAMIQAGDLLMELNNQAVRNNTELSQALDALKTGEEVPVKLYRDGETVSSRIKLGDRYFPPLMPKPEPDDQGFLGILDSARRCCLPGTKKWGVEINELHVNGPAELFGLRPGDVITEFDQHPVKTPNEFNRRIRAVKPRSKVSVTFYRGNTEQKVEVIIGHRW